MSGIVYFIYKNLNNNILNRQNMTMGDANIGIDLSIWQSPTTVEAELN